MRRALAYSVKGLLALLAVLSVSCQSAYRPAGSGIYSYAQDSIFLRLEELSPTQARLYLREGSRATLWAVSGSNSGQLSFSSQPLPDTFCLQQVGRRLPNTPSRLRIQAVDDPWHLRPVPRLYSEFQGHAGYSLAGGVTDSNGTFQMEVGGITRTEGARVIDSVTATVTLSPQVAQLLGLPATRTVRIPRYDKNTVTRVVVERIVIPLPADSLVIPIDTTAGTAIVSLYHNPEPPLAITGVQVSPASGGGVQVRYRRGLARRTFTLLPLPASARPAAYCN